MSEKVRVGFVGAGWMGQTLMKRVTEHPHAEVVGLYQPTRETGGRALQELGLSPSLLADSFESLIAREDVDAVFLTGPNHTHGPQSIAALEAGKHVFCEKPATTTFAEHRRQLELARAQPHLQTYVDYILYFDSFEQRLRGMIADGAFGKITQAQVNYRHPINIAGNKVWKLKRELMGDAIGMGINHAVSVLLLAMESQARPASVFATSMPAQVRGFEADPIWNLLISFDNGAAGVVLGNIDSANGYDAYHNFSGTQGAIIFDSILDRPQKVRYWSEEVAEGKWIYPLDADRCREAGIEPWPAQTTTPDSGNVVEHQTGECVDHFIESVRSGRPSPLSMVNSAGVAEIGWAAQVSARTGKPVSLPLDHAEAARYLD